MKICGKCLVEKHDFDFLATQKTCNECVKIRKNKNQKKYYSQNKDDRIEYAKCYRLKNDDELKDKARAKRQTIEYKEYYRNYVKDYKKKKKLDPSFVLRETISHAINEQLKKNYSSKNKNSCLNYLPYTIDELKNHLESLFESWMNWNNRGIYKISEWNDNDQSTWKWQLDHIIPQSDLPYVSMEDDNFKKCWSLENLRPYCAKQNNLDGVNKIRHKKKGS